MSSTRLFPHLLLATAVMLTGARGAESVREVDPDLLLESWAESSAGPSYLYKPTSVAISSQGEIFVLDAGNQRVAVFGPDGDFRYSFGRAGQGPGEFNLGTDPEDDIAVDGDYVVVFEKQRQILHVFDMHGHVIDQFAMASRVASWTSMSFLDGRIVVGVLPRQVGQPTVVEYSIRGEKLRELGASDFEGKLSSLNKGYVATDRAGMVRQAQLYFPMIRALGTDRDVDEWHDFAWWPDQSLRGRATDGQNESDRETLRLQPGDQDIIGRHTVFWDLEYADQANEWVGLVYGPLVQMFDAEGVPSRAFVPLDGLTEEERDGWPWDIGVDPSAQRVCVAFYNESLVRCYPVPDR